MLYSLPCPHERLLSPCHVLGTVLRCWEWSSVPQAPHPPELTFQAGRGNKAKSFHSLVDREKGYGRKESVGET